MTAPPCVEPVGVESTSAEPTIGDLLGSTGLPGLLETTPSELLAGLPDLPALPGIDLSGLVAPIHELLGTFGTGVLPGGTGDPVGALTGLAGVLDEGVSAGSSALRLLDGAWSGQGGAAAAATAARASADGQALSAQGGAMAADVTAAAGIVAAGLATVQGIAVKTAGLVAATCRRS